MGPANKQKKQILNTQNTPTLIYHQQTDYATTLIKFTRPPHTQRYRNKPTLHTALHKIFLAFLRSLQTNNKNSKKQIIKYTWTR